jgi:hypothetical protein
MAFKKGNTGNPNGRPKGSPNKTTKALKEMILGALDQAGGEAYLLQQARENPNAFLTLVGKVLPTTLAGDKSADPIKTENAHTVAVPDSVMELVRAVQSSTAKDTGSISGKD